MEDKRAEPPNSTRLELQKRRTAEKTTPRQPRPLGGRGSALVRTRGPSSVMATVCSKVGRARAVEGDDGPAIGERFHLVTTHVHHRFDGDGKARLSLAPRCGLPKFGTCGSSCMAAPTPWPTRSRTTVNFGALHHRLYGGADVSPT